MIIAIDGPAGSGKSTIAKLLAKKLGFFYLDSGALYRAITWALLDKGVDIQEEAKVNQALKNIQISFEYNLNFKVFVGSRDVTEEIRLPYVSQAVSLVSSYKKVREMVNEIQKSSVKENAVVEGRDITSVVFPFADLKIFLEASIEERARRRWLEWQIKGIEGSLEQARKDIEQRDLLDSSRKHAPLKVAKGAIVIDTTKLTPEEVVDRIFQLVNKKERKDWFWNFAYCLLWLPVKVLFRLKVNGKENLNLLQGPAVVISNHKSYIDPIILGLAIKKPISFMAKAELFSYPLFSFIIKKLHAFPVRRGTLDREAIKKGLERLKMGYHLGIFPEGTRIHHSELGSFKKGVILFLKEGNFPVLPVAIKGTERLLKWWVFLPLFNKIEVNIGKPFKLDLTVMSREEAVDKLKVSVEELYYDRNRKS